MNKTLWGKVESNIANAISMVYPQYSIPVYCREPDQGKLTDGIYLYEKEGKFTLIQVERGNMYSPAYYGSIDELEFAVYSNILFNAATDKRIFNALLSEFEDSRKEIFRRQLVLSRKLGTKIHNRMRKEIMKIIEKAPLRNNETLKELQQQDEDSGDGFHDPMGHGAG